MPPASSPGAVTPIDVGIGGNATCSNVFPKVGALPSLKTYLNVNPTTGTSSADGTSFGLTMSNPSGGQRLAITSSPAVAIAGVALNGGTDNAAYDYTGLDFPHGATTSWVSADGNLHAPAKNPNQTYTISHLTICYRLLATISGTVFTDANGSGSPTGQAGLGNVTVTLKDNTTGYQTTATTPNGGAFSFNQPVGDSYTVCSTLPTGYQQSAPTSGGATCTTGATGGYLHPVPSTGSTNNNFGFRPLGSVAGTVFNDVNQNLANDDGSPLGGWTVTLYGGAQPVSTTSNTDGSYKINAAFSTSTQYTLCETPPSGAPAGNTWAQDVPLPSSTTVCGPNKNGNGASGVPNELLKGLQFTPGNGRRHDHRQGLRATSRQSRAIPTEPFLLPPGYDVNLPPSTCSTTGTKAHTGFVVDSGVEPDGTPFVSVWTGDSLGAKVPLLEHINFPDALNPDGTLKYTHLVYTDPFPFTGTPVTMPACKVDPRDASDPTKLSTTPVDYTSPDNSSAVLPSGATSCVISLTTSGTVASGGSLDAEVYSAVDGLRQPG